MKPMNYTSDLIDTLELLPYQEDFAANTARFKIGLWARQTGKDHTATAEAVIADLFDLLSHRELQELLHTGPRRAEQELSAPA